MPSQARGTPGKSGKKTPNNPRPIKTNDIIVAAITILLYHIVRPSAPTPKKVSCKDRRFSIPADRAPACRQAGAYGLGELLFINDDYNKKTVLARLRQFLHDKLRQAGLAPPPLYFLRNPSPACRQAGSRVALCV